MVEARRVRVAAVGDVASGEGRVVEVEGKTLALFNVEGPYYAIDNACAHRGGPLGAGELDGCVVTCPWHAWRWDGASGATVNSPAGTAGRYPVRAARAAAVVERPWR